MLKFSKKLNYESLLFINTSIEQTLRLRTFPKIFNIEYIFSQSYLFKYHSFGKILFGLKRIVLIIQIITR